MAVNGTHSNSHFKIKCCIKLNFKNQRLKQQLGIWKLVKYHCQKKLTLYWQGLYVPEIICPVIFWTKLHRILGGENISKHREAMSEHLKPHQPKWPCIKMCFKVQTCATKPSCCNYSMSKSWNSFPLAEVFLVAVRLGLFQFQEFGENKLCKYSWCYSWMKQLKTELWLEVQLVNSIRPRDQ